MTTSEVSSGLVLPYVAVMLAGKGGAAALVLLCFCGATSYENPLTNSSDT